MLRYKTKTRPGLVALYDIQPGIGAGPFLQPRSPHDIRPGNCSVYSSTWGLHATQGCWEKTDRHRLARVGEDHDRARAVLLQILVDNVYEVHVLHGRRHQHILLVQRVHRADAISTHSTEFHNPAHPRLLCSNKTKPQLFRQSWQIKQKWPMMKIN